MPTLSVSKTYSDGNTLSASDLDTALGSVETFINSTKIDSTNIQTGGLAAANYAAGSVGTAALASNAVTSAILASDASVDGNRAVQSNHIRDEAVTLVKLVAAVQAALCPTGSTMGWPVSSSPPTGWLLCDGTAVSRSTYSALFAKISTYHGSGDGSTTFNLPNYQGRFLRMVDGSAGVDPDKASRTAMASGGNTGNNVGSVQADAFEAHTHTWNLKAGSTTSGVPTDGGTSGSFTITTSSTGGNETRPENAYTYFIIKT